MTTMADRSQRYGMDPEDMRQVILHIGQPAPTTLMPTITLRTGMLLILLAITILLGLGSLAGATANQEPVKKGSGRARDIQITPLEKLEMESPAAARQLYNFLQIFPVHRAQASEPHESPLQPQAALPVPMSPMDLLLAESRREHRADEPFKLTIALAFFSLVVLWLHLRARGHEADRNWRKKK